MEEISFKEFIEARNSGNFGSINHLRRTLRFRNLIGIRGINDYNDEPGNAAKSYSNFAEYLIENYNVDIGVAEDNLRRSPRIIQLSNGKFLDKNYNPDVLMEKCVKWVEGCQALSTEDFFFIYQINDATHEDVNSQSTTSTSAENYCNKLRKSKNIIFRGAPGTGKTYLAKQIATSIVSNGKKTEYTHLSDEEKSRIGFVQFHPSYDYTDFVEGLRPIDNGNGTIGFERKDGIFKEFVDKARKNFVNAQKNNYVFIIDEINRGEISKILGELFFSIDPEYRGENGAVSTQYANLHDDPNEKFYIPENVYIIGTMNDIDRSVDSFDFAMRRRFRFIEIKADDNISMLDKLGDKADKAKERMEALNAEILKTDGLDRNYQIGAAYFLKLGILSDGDLWTDCLEPLLHDYVCGMSNEEEIMQNFKDAFDLTNNGTADEQ